jgi:phosphotransferase system enzyme I (PtsI)
MMRERVGDLTDVHIRLLSLLLGLPDHDPVEVPKGAKRSSSPTTSRRA